MAIFKCKMCGAQLTVQAEHKITTCSYCGSTQTIPNGDDEQKFALYNRANTLRMRSSFDESIVAYQSIITNFPKEAEALWGLCLSKYGIEYVDDPKTGDKIPTCHRTLYDSILDDPDYLEAIKYADVIAKDVYVAEAKKIDKIQKRILRISQKEEPYDIFICYKESDDAGGRTVDSVLAYDIYEKLTEKGYKVFFSRVTLEGKLGQEFEPIIFAALRSSKIMLAVGTKEEYFNAVWVKNEWSRFLSFMAEDNGKYLIPCFKDIDPYDMPKEFAPLQAQDMSKIGCLQDLVRGIDKLFGKDKKVSDNINQTFNATTGLSGYYSRIESNIKAGQFDKADWLIETVLSMDENDAKSYFYKIFIDNNEKDLNFISNGVIDPFSYKNFAKAYKCANAAFKAKLDLIVEEVKNNVNEEKYRAALGYRNKNLYDDAIKALEVLGDYKDSKKLIEEFRVEKAKYEEEQKINKNLSVIREKIETFLHRKKIVEREIIRIKINKKIKSRIIIFFSIALLGLLGMSILNAAAMINFPEHARNMFLTFLVMSFIPIVLFLAMFLAFLKNKKSFKFYVFITIVSLVANLPSHIILWYSGSGGDPTYAILGLIFYDMFFIFSIVLGRNYRKIDFVDAPAKTTLTKLLKNYKVDKENIQQKINEFIQEYKTIALENNLPIPQFEKVLKLKK